jgi:hypothetical protein
MLCILELPLLYNNQEVLFRSLLLCWESASCPSRSGHHSFLRCRRLYLMTHSLILVFIVEYIKRSHIFFISVLMLHILLLLWGCLTYSFINWRGRFSLNWRAWIGGLRFSCLCTRETEVLEVILVSKFIDFMIFVDLRFAINVIPFVALIAHQPVLSICNVWVSIIVNLLAEITVLALVISVCAYLA